MYASYKDQVEFLIVYILEAHPEMLRAGNKFDIVNRQPENMKERLLLATECVTQYKFTIPMVIDDLDQKVARDYKTRYVRTTIVDKDGKVAYYAGPGPFDFKIPKIERAIKKIIANNGYLPPPPEPQFGPENNGLRLGISVDPPQFAVGDDVLVQLKFENISQETYYLLYQPDQAHENLIIKNSAGQILTVKPAVPQSQMDRMMAQMTRPSSNRIRPLEFYVGEIEGKVVAATEDIDVDPGSFIAVSSFEITEEDLSQTRRSPSRNMWTGKLTSGMCVMDVALPAQETCLDCHGSADYHHSDFQAENCNDCHIGQTGAEDFTTNDSACSNCHPFADEKKFGRRQILGPGGEFEMTSKHIPGPVDDSDCALCHDTSRHQKGVVRLINHENGSEALTDAGPSSGFCLSCHDGSPPAGVTFPDKAKGSGYDKSDFSLMGHGGQVPGCAVCHTSHGSTLPALLKNIHRDH